MSSSSMFAKLRSASRPSSAGPSVSKWEWLGLISLGVLSISLLLVALNGDWRDAVHSHFRPPFRTVLSKASGDFLGTGTWLDILKVQSDEGLFVEVYATDPKQASRLIERLHLSGNKDAYFHSKLQATRLVIEDIDGSGRPSIVVPSFDDDLVAHINVFRILENGQTQQVADNR